MKIIVIGGSIATHSIVQTLLRYGRDLNITIISEESDIFYSKCLLTYLLGKEIEEKELFFGSVGQLNGRVKLYSNTKAIAIDGQNKKVICDNGLSFDYDRLVIATGADPIKPSYCKEENRVFTVRYKNDIAKIEKHLKNRAVVIGGGYVGLKTAFSLVRRNIDTTVIISSQYPLSVTADEETGKTIEKELNQMGIKTITRCDVREIAPKNDNIKICLTSGDEISADLCIVGKGVKPRTELLSNSSVSVNVGIPVNQYLQTSDPDIFAIGDCAETYDIVREDNYLNAIWPNAVEQAYYAALNILGRNVSYAGSVLMNSIKTDQFHLITAGILKGDGVTLYEHRNSSKNQYRKIALKNGRLVGLAFFNNPEDAGFYVNLVKKGGMFVDKPLEFLEKADIRSVYYRPFR